MVPFSWKSKPPDLILIKKMASDLQNSSLQPSISWKCEPARQAIPARQTNPARQANPAKQANPTRQARPNKNQTAKKPIANS